MPLNYASAPTMAAALHWLVTHDDPEGDAMDATTLADLERHRPIRRPYPGATGVHLAHCPECDAPTPRRGLRERARLDGSPPYACLYWRMGVEGGHVSPDHTR